MKQPLYLTLRAAGQGALTGSLISIALGLVVYYGGDLALLALLLFAAPALLGISHLLEWRARRITRKE